MKHTEFNLYRDAIMLSTAEVVGRLLDGVKVKVSLDQQCGAINIRVEGYHRGKGYFYTHMCSTLQVQPGFYDEVLRTRMPRDVGAAIADMILRGRDAH